MNACTWKNCQEKASNPWIGKNGKEWANLCDKHHKELDDSIGDPDCRIMLKNWVLASGGSNKMASEMVKQ